MYRMNTRIARQVGRVTGRTAVPFRGPRIHRNRVRAIVGATASVIATFWLFPWLCRLAESGAERREGSQ